jgi:hypothetical protein
MNREQLLKDVVDHLVEQAEQAIIRKGTGAEMCSYRAVRDGKVLKCAIGALIPNELYEPSMEGKSVGQVFQQYPKVEAHFAATYGSISGNDLDFLQHVQRLHDGHWGDWSREHIEARAKQCSNMP